MISRVVGRVGRDSFFLFISSQFFFSFHFFRFPFVFTLNSLFPFILSFGVLRALQGMKLPS